MLELNVKQIQEKKNVEADEWKVIKDGYDQWIRELRVLNTKFLMLVLLLSGIFSYLLSGWLRIVLIIVAVYTIVEIAKREGHREGYMDGYMAGLDQGVNKSFGMEDEIAEMATQMKLDEEIDLDFIEKKED